jgi:hypothetical protein
LLEERGVDRIPDWRTSVGCAAASLFLHWLATDDRLGGLPRPVEPVAAYVAEPPRPLLDARRLHRFFGVRVHSDAFLPPRSCDAEFYNLLRSPHVRIVPTFRSGVARHLKLFSIRPGSCYADIGLRNGDLVRRLDGSEIDFPDKALEIYGRIRTVGRHTIEILRDGRPKTLRYSVTDSCTCVANLSAKTARAVPF